MTLEPRLSALIAEGHDFIDDLQIVQISTTLSRSDTVRTSANLSIGQASRVERDDRAS